MPYIFGLRVHEFLLQATDMSGALVIFSAICVSVSVVNAANFGIGVWETLAINKCEEDSHIFKFDITLMKNINDTHDGCKGHIVLDEDFNQDYGVRLEICKIEDGSCKQSQTIADDCLVDFFETYAKERVADCLNAIKNLDSTEMPIPKGEYDIENYVFSNEPAISMFGMYNVTVFVLNGEQEVGCMATQLEFKKTEEDEK